jgi:hypothetical protein
MQYRICGVDVVPVKTESREEGGGEFILFYPRVIALNEKNKPYSAIVGRGKDTKSKAVGELLAFTKQWPIGSIIMDRWVSSLRPFRIWYPEHSEVPGTGEVVGYIACYQTGEAGSGPQLVKAVALMVDLPDGGYNNIYARLTPPGTSDIDDEANIAEEITGAINLMAGSWTFGSQLKYIPRVKKFTRPDPEHPQGGFAYYLLGEILPDEDQARPTADSLRTLAEHFGSPQ